MEIKTSKNIPYIWCIPEDYPEKCIGIYDRKRSPDRFEFKKGVKLPDTIGLPIFQFEVSAEKLTKWDELPNSADVPLVNQRLLDLLLKLAPNDIQVFDARLETKDGILPGYKLINVTNTVYGIDHEASECSYITGTRTPRSIKRLSYKENCLGNHQMARDAECHSHLLVSPVIREAFMTGKIRGVKLLTAEEMIGRITND